MGLSGCMNPFKLWKQVKMSSLGPTKFLAGAADALGWAHFCCHQLNIWRFCQEPQIGQSFTGRCSRWLWNGLSLIRRSYSLLRNKYILSEMLQTALRWPRIYWETLLSLADDFEMAQLFTVRHCQWPQNGPLFLQNKHKLMLHHVPSPRVCYYSNLSLQIQVIHTVKSAYTIESAA